MSSHNRTPRHESSSIFQCFHSPADPPPISSVHPQPPPPPPTTPAVRSPNYNDFPLRREITVSCPICLDQKPQIEWFTMHCCAHAFCIACMGTYVETRVHEGVIAIRCPSFGCRATVDMGAVRSIVRPEVYHRWRSAFARSSVVVLSEKQFYCPYKDCSALLTLDDHKREEEFLCPHCKRGCCAKCGVEWHKGLSCEEYQKSEAAEEGRREAAAFDALVKEERWQRCPACKFYVEKDKLGCDYIQCRCGHGFCYVCGGEMKTHYCENCSRIHTNVPRIIPIPTIPNVHFGPQWERLSVRGGLVPPQNLGLHWEHLNVRKGLVPPQNLGPPWECLDVRGGLVPPHDLGPQWERLNMRGGPVPSQNLGPSWEYLNVRGGLVPPQNLGPSCERLNVRGGLVPPQNLGLQWERLNMREGPVPPQNLRPPWERLNVREGRVLPQNLGLPWEHLNVREGPVPLQNLGPPWERLNVRGGLVPPQNLEPQWEHLSVMGGVVPPLKRERGLDPRLEFSSLRIDMDPRPTL